MHRGTNISIKWSIMVKAKNIEDHTNYQISNFSKSNFGLHRTLSLPIMLTALFEATLFSSLRFVTYKTSMIELYNSG